MVVAIYFNEWLEDSFTTLPFWIPTLVFAVIAMIASIFVLKSMRRSEIMKHEFITTATHKFRTPLTHIKWAAENLMKSGLTDDQRMQIEYIEGATGKLVELTNLLMSISGHESGSFDYKMVPGDVSDIAEQALMALEDQFTVRKIHVSRNLEKRSIANFDSSRIRFVLQTFLENAIRYSPDGSSIDVTVSRQGNHVVCTVKDNGIGIPPNELSLLFSKFYRGKQATLTDTEGMGIGLYMSKEIVSHHHGKIWAESKGKQLGSTFGFSLPLAE